MTNSDKLKAYLDKGNGVKSTHVHNGSTRVYYDYDTYGFDTDDEWVNAANIDMDDLVITPIHRKPNWKVGELVDVSEEFGDSYFKGGKGYLIESISAYGVHIVRPADTFETACVPFHYLSPHIEKAEEINKGLDRLYKTKKIEGDIITFEDFVKYAKESTDPPHWSFEFEGYSVTHEDDKCYLISLGRGVPERFTPNHHLVRDKVDYSLNIKKNESEVKKIERLVYGKGEMQITDYTNKINEIAQLLEDHINNS